MKLKYFIILILILLVGAGVAYWYFIFGPNTAVNLTNMDRGTIINRFNPFSRSTDVSDPVTNSKPTTNTDNRVDNIDTKPIEEVGIPSLRLLSNTPVGGYSASTTASTTIIRWIDRGRGNIYETNSETTDISTISNTIVPKILKSVWNRDLTSFVATIQNENDTLSSVYAELRRRPFSTTTTESSTFAQYELKGRNIPQNLVGFATSPKKDRFLMLVNDSGTSYGYISTFDGSKLTKVFETPMTSITVEWPEENTIAVTNKANASQNGYLYFVNVKTGDWKKILGPERGLVTKVNSGAKFVLYSTVDYEGKGIKTKLLDVTKNTHIDAPFRTIVNKCVWGNFYMDIVYCGIPPRFEDATYPDDWYIGKTSFVDKVWQLNAKTNEIKLVSDIISESKKIIDAIDLTLDNKDNYLLFTNKNDLSLWAIDLIKAK